MNDGRPTETPERRDADPAGKTSTRVPHLMRAGFLRDLTDAAKARFLDACTAAHYPVTTALLTQGEPAPGMLIVAEGAVEVTSFGPEGQSLMIHVARPGETLGEAEVLSENPCAATCTAIAGTTVLFCPPNLLRSMTAKPVFLRNLANVFYQRLVRDNNTKFVDQFYSVEQRLCACLHRLSLVTPEITRTQSELAGFLACARQTLNRELGRLRDSGVIAISKGRIRVLDREALVRRGPIGGPSPSGTTPGG